MLTDYLPIIVYGPEMTILVNFIECEVNDATVEMPVLEDFEYQIGDEALEVSYDAFTSTHATLC